MDVVGTCVSMALQYGVPLITLVDKFRHARFEPAGMTSNKNIPFAKSLIDYIFCWMGCQFIAGYAEKNTPNGGHSAPAAPKTDTTAKQLVEKTKDLAHKINEAKALQKKSADKPEKPQDVIRRPTLAKPDRGIERPTETAVVAGPAEIYVEGPAGEAAVMNQFNSQFQHFQDDAPACDVCGSICVRNGTCYRCFNCGNSMGCS
jgi:ribonucleoside-diphosphate reductase alpha chain